MFHQVTWYDVVAKGNSTVIEGRLRYKYYSVRQTLCKANLISKKAIEKDLQIEAINGMCTYIVLLFHPLYISVFEKLLLTIFAALKDDDIQALDQIANVLPSCPWPDICEIWENSNEVRQRFRLSKTVSINIYVGKFPLLNHPRGWELVS